MVVSSPQLIVCLSGCDLTSICVVLFVEGLTMDAPSVGLPVFLSVRVHKVAGVPSHLELSYMISCVVGSSWVCFWLWICV